MVSDLIPIPSRRQFLRQTTFLAAAFATRGAFADMLAPTPRLTEGPFYPDKLPLDTDNDLLILNDSLTPAVGEITYLTGQVLGPNGSPVRNAFVEIWQVDNNGAYLHTGDSRHELLDKNFQGYGRFLTDSEGRYSFRTIKPVPYPGRTPHIHLAVSRNGKRALTTQLLIKGHPQNERDGVFRALTDPAQRELLLVDFTPLPQSKLGELHAKFDVVLGVTPADDDDGLKGVAKPDRETGGGGRPPGGPGGRPPGRPPGPPPRN